MKLWRAREWSVILLGSLAALGDASPISSTRSPGTLVKRAGEPKFGMELEFRKIIMDCDEIKGEVQGFDVLKYVKGRKLELGDTEAKDDDRFLLSAEIEPPSLAKIFAEYIVNHEQVALDATEAKNAAQAVVDHLNSWKPQSGGEVSIPSVPLAGGSTDLTWKITSPAKWDPAVTDILQRPAIQATLAIPLAGINELFRMAEEGESNPLLTGVRAPLERMHHAQSQQFDCAYDENTLGFISLVTSYAKAALQPLPDGTAKKITSIMPRTAFPKMYQMVKSNLDGKALVDLISDAAKWDSRKGGSGDKDENYDVKKMLSAEFKWEDSTTSVQQWLESIESKSADERDTLSELDSKRYDQVGSLKGKTESVKGTDIEAPIFEFRDLGDEALSKVGNRAETIANAALNLHQSFGQPQKLRARADGAACVSKDKDKKCDNGMAKLKGICTKCPDGQRPAANLLSCEPDTCPPGQAQTGIGGKCESCGKGTKPSLDGKKCEEDKPDDADKCPDGQAKTGLDGKCELCKDGMLPAADGKSCEQKPEDDDKCSEGQAKLDGKCQACKQGEIPGLDGKSCIKDPKDDDKDKDKNKIPDDDKDKEGKKGRGKFCLLFMAQSGFLEGAEELGTDEGIAAVEAASEEWPEDVQFAAGELTNSNIELIETQMVVTGIEISTRSTWKRQLAGLFRALGSAGKGAGNAGKAADEVVIMTSKGVKQNPAKVEKLKAMSKADRTKSADDSIKKAKDNPSYKSCLLMAATTVGQAKLHIDDIPPGGFKAEGSADNVLRLTMNEGEDNKGKWYERKTFEDTYFHPQRMFPGQCTAVEGIEGVSSYDVGGGCCGFYKDKGCGEFLFAATNREDHDLEGNGAFNDMISSFTCVFDQGCAGVNGFTGGENAAAFKPGQCGIHFKQYQRDEGYTGGMRFDVELKDANGVGVAKVEDAEAVGDKLEVKGRIPLPFTLTVHGDEDVDLAYGGESWNSQDDRCKCGAYDGDGGNAGNRQCDCGFSCPAE